MPVLRRCGAGGQAQAAERLTRARGRERRAAQGADGGTDADADAEAAEAAVDAARRACGELQRSLLDGELGACEALGGLLGQAERRHADAAEAARQHFVAFFGMARLHRPHRACPGRCGPGARTGRCRPRPSRSACGSMASPVVGGARWMMMDSRNKSGIVCQ